MTNRAMRARKRCESQSNLGLYEQATTNHRSNSKIIQGKQEGESRAYTRS
jgi:hypothetical protein